MNVCLLNLFSRRHISIFIFFSVATLFNVDVFFILNIIVEIFFVRRMLFCQTSTGRIKISQWGRWVGIVKRQRWVITAYVRKFEIISYFLLSEIGRNAEIRCTKNIFGLQKLIGGLLWENDLI